MYRVLFLALPVLAGCAALRDAAEVAREEIAARGGEIIDKVGGAVSGDPTALVGAITAVCGVVVAIVVRTIVKRRRER